MLDEIETIIKTDFTFCQAVGIAFVLAIIEEILFFLLVWWDKKKYGENITEED